VTVANFPISAGGFFGSATERGVSSDAGAITKHFVDILGAFYETYSIQEVHRGAHRSLYVAVAEASVVNWDGYGAQPVRRQTAANALWLLQSLPASVPGPDVSVDPDGEIAFEWQPGPGRAFSISIGTGDIVTFAGLRGRKRIRGTEVLVDGLPKSLLFHLGQTLLA